MDTPSVVDVSAIRQFLSRSRHLTIDARTARPIGAGRYALLTEIAVSLAVTTVTTRQF